MLKNPLHYKKEDIGEIMNRPIIIEVGSHNSDQIEETLEGIITNCTLASNEPYLPASIRIKTTNGNTRNFSLFEVKKFRNP